MKFSQDDQTAIWKIIAAILHLGNVEVGATTDGEISMITDMDKLEPIAKVLGEYVQCVCVCVCVCARVCVRACACACVCV